MQYKGNEQNLPDYHVNTLLRYWMELKLPHAEFGKLGQTVHFLETRP